MNEDILASLNFIGDQLKRIADALEGNYEHEHSAKEILTEPTATVTVSDWMDVIGKQVDQLNENDQLRSVS